MASPNEDIYHFQDSPSLARVPPRAAPVRPASRWRLIWGELIIWCLAAVFVTILGYWACVAGMKLRGELWRSTRTIRFDWDINNAVQLGNDALREAERLANLRPFADARAPQTLPVSKNFRRLTNEELIEGLVHDYDAVVAEHPSGIYGLDYPPLRLMVMTLWVRQVQRNNPAVAGFPTAERVEDPLHERAADLADASRTHDTLLGQREDFASPLLEFNAICEGVAAVGAFWLVWLWVVRSSRERKGDLPAGQAAAGVAGKRRVIPTGIVAFAVSTAGFWYALLTLAPPPLRPCPEIVLQRVTPERSRAEIYATVNGQGLRTFYRVDWGTGAAYTHSSGVSVVPAIARFARDSALPPEGMRVRVGLDGLEAGQIIHYRLVAYNGQGSTASRDEEFVAGGPAVTLAPRPIGGVQWPDWTVWLRLGAIFLAMVISARLLPPWHRGWACGIVAALLIWFNPILLLDGHVWPQWDVWILPFVVLSLLAVSFDAWILTGAIIGAGCLLKGQLLLGTPVLLVWPLVSGKIGNVLRLLAGFATGAGAVLSPWLFSYDSPAFHDAWRWIASVMVAAGIALTLSFTRGLIWRQRRPQLPRTDDERKNQPYVEAVRGPASPAWHIWWPGVGLVSTAAVVGAVAGLVLLYRNWPSPSGGHLIWALLALLALVAALPWVLWRRFLPAWTVCVFAASIWLAAFAFFPSGSNFNWWKVAFDYGTTGDERVQQGLRSFANLPAIMAQEYGWNDLRETAWDIHLDLSLPRPIHFSFVRDYQLDLRSVLVTVYGVCVLACGISAAVHARRRDARLLVALVAPWVIFPLVLGQMSERYLLWGSALTALCIAVSTGLTLLHVLLAVAGAGMMLHQLLDGDPGRWLDAHYFLGRLWPGFGWAMLLIAAIFLFSAFVPTRRSATRL